LARLATFYHQSRITDREEDHTICNKQQLQSKNVTIELGSAIKVGYLNGYLSEFVAA
jgi:hypothetical protein